MYKLAFAAFMLFMLCGAHSATACEAAPWYDEVLSGGSAAIVYGEITESSAEGRAGTLQVRSYIGPGEAPRTVHLPATVTSQRTREDSCPDFSMTFEKGQSYVVFLKTAGKAPELLHPSWVTALFTTGDEAITSITGEREKVADLMLGYAHGHGEPLQVPGPDSPVWGATAKTAAKAATAGFLSALPAAGVITAALVTGGFYLWWRKKRLLAND